MRRQMFFLIVFSLLLVSGVLGASRFYSPYYQGYGGSGDLSHYFDLFLDFIEQNEYVLDAIVFLVVFLIVVKRALGEKYSKDKALYIVIGVALTIGLMMYERNVLQGSLIIHSGWLGIFILIIFGIYLVASQAGNINPIRMILLSILWLIIGYLIPSYLTMYNLYGALWYQIIFIALPLVALGLGAGWLLFLWKPPPRSSGGSNS